MTLEHDYIILYSLKLQRHLICHFSIVDAGLDSQQSEEALIDDLKETSYLHSFTHHHLKIPSHLWECTLQENIWDKLRNVSHLNLSSTALDEAGYHVAELIRNWKGDPPLKTLNMSECSMPINAWSELLKSLSVCKHLTHLILSDSVLGEAGIYLTHSIRSWGDDPPLQVLNLRKCSIPQNVSSNLLRVLSTCKHLTHIFLSNNILNREGYNVADLMGSLRNIPVLNYLDLSGCCLPPIVNGKLLQALSTCHNLTVLNLSGNTLTGSFNHFLPDHGLPSLEKLHLIETSLNQTDVVNLADRMRLGKLSGLGTLNLQKNNLSAMESEVEHLLEVCATSHTKSIHVLLAGNNLSDDFLKKWRKLLEGTNVYMETRTFHDKNPSSVPNTLQVL